MQARHLTLLVLALAPFAASCASAQVPTGPDVHASRGRLHFTAGERQLFSLQISVRQPAGQPTLGDGSGEGTLAADVDLALDVEEAHAGLATVAVTVEAVRNLDFTQRGQRVVADLEAAEAELVGNVARLHAREDGTVASVTFERGASAPFTALVLAWLAETRLELHDGASWTALEASTAALSEANYAWEGEGHTGAGTLHKRTGTVRELRLPRGRLAGTPRATGSSSFLFSAGHVESAEGQRTLQLQNAVGQALPLAEVRWQLSLIATGTSVAQRPFSAPLTRRPDGTAAAEDSP